MYVGLCDEVVEETLVFWIVTLGELGKACNLSGNFGKNNAG